MNLEPHEAPRAEPLPRIATCHCGTSFAPTPAQRHSMRHSLNVYCSRACRPKPGPKPGSTVAHTAVAIFQLGAFVHTGIEAACVCRKPATHLAAALYHGRIAAVPVCSDCARMA